MDRVLEVPGQLEDWSSPSVLSWQAGGSQGHPVSVVCAFLHVCHCVGR